MIIGYRADDSYFTFAQDFVAGAISLKKLSEAMRLGKFWEQIVLKSEKAFEHIRFVGAEPADAETYFDGAAWAVRDPLVLIGTTVTGDNYWNAAQEAECRDPAN